MEDDLGILRGIISVADQWYKDWPLGLLVLRHPEEDSRALRQCMSIAELHALANAARRALPKTQTVQVQTWRVSWSNRVNGKWIPVSDTYVRHDFAVARHADLVSNAGPDVSCVSLTGPHMHQQEIPDEEIKRDPELPDPWRPGGLAGAWGPGTGKRGR